eukprot:gene9553-1757_t
MSYVASYRDVVLAKASEEEIQVVEGNIYFPKSSLNTKYLRPSSTTSFCGWKGIANYFDAKIDEDGVKDCCWTYLDPKSEAKHIQGFGAFWKGVKVEKK